MKGFVKATAIVSDLSTVVGFIEATVIVTELLTLGHTVDEGQ